MNHMEAQEGGEQREERQREEAYAI